MRILTVRQPWAWAIIHGGKDVENRTRNIAGDYRGPVAIHAAVRLPSFKDHWDAGTVIADITGIRPLFHPPGSLGHIIGVVDLVEVHDGTVESLHAHNGDVIVTSPCSPWALPDYHHLELANPRRLENPISFTGSLGLRRLDADMVERITEEVAA